MAMIPGTDLPPNGVDPLVWAEVAAAIKKIAALPGVERGYPLVVYRDASGVYVHSLIGCNNLVSARLEIRGLDSQESEVISFRDNG